MKEHCVVSRVQFPSVLLYIIFSKQSDVQHYKSLYSLGTMLELEIVQGATPWCTNPTLSSVQDTLKILSVQDSMFFQCRTHKGTRIGYPIDQQSTAVIQFKRKYSKYRCTFHYPVHLQSQVQTRMGVTEMQQSVVRLHFVPFLPSRRYSCTSTSNIKEKYNEN